MQREVGETLHPRNPKGGGGSMGLKINVVMGHHRRCVSARTWNRERDSPTKEPGGLVSPKGDEWTLKESEIFVLMCFLGGGGATV